MAISGDTAARPASATPDPFIDPDTLPDEYAVVCAGNCLEPVIADGTCLAFSRLVRPEVGDFIVLWFRPEATPPGEHLKMVKRLAMALPPEFELPLDRGRWSFATPLVVVEMLNPARRWAIPATELLAVHTVVGIAEQQPDGGARYRPGRPWLEGR